MNKTLVVNYHILERCNFGCRYCFAHWPKGDKNSLEVWKCSITREKLLDEVQKLPACIKGNWDRVRLNIAGGEPMLLYKGGHLGNIMEYARGLGMGLSIITNGYLVKDEFIHEWAPKLEIIGISMDSSDVETNVAIGRCSKSGKQITNERIAEIFRLARKVNPGIECKLNTVVNALNWQERFHSAIELIAPDRWKVFQMLPISDTPDIAEKQEPLKISAENFEAFCERHKDMKHLMSPEDNDAMIESYWMIDPLGRFYQTESAGNNYRHVNSMPVHEVGAKDAVDQVVFHEDKYHKRYVTPMKEAS